MKRLIPAVLLLSTDYSAALKPISDHELEAVTGQAGITLETSSALSIDELAYIQDGNQLQIQDIQRGQQGDISQASLTTQIVDIEADGTLRIATEVDPTRVTVGAVRINDSAGSVGQFQLDYSGTSLIRVGASQSGDNYLEGSFQTSISDAELVWTTNGSSLSFDDIGYNANVTRLGIGEAVRGNQTGLNFDLEQFAYSFSSGGLKLGDVSLGTLSGELALSGDAQLYAGGRSGSEGISLDANINILQDPDNFVRFTDDGNDLFMGDFNGSLSVSNLTLDVESDHLLLGYDRLDGTFNADRIMIGDAVNPVGAIQLDFLFVDGNGYSNRTRLYPGIRQPVLTDLPVAIRPYAQNFYTGLSVNSEGLSAAVEWNLEQANVAYIDNTRTVIFSGIESYGRGDVTLDLRQFDHDNNPGTLNKSAIALGLNRFQGSYSIDGLKVGNKNAPIQGGAELLLSLEVFQAMDFNLDGYTLITAGGVSGGGIQVDGDYLFSDSNIGLSVDENGQGVWATGVDYEIHLRGFQVDVSDSGLSINRTEQWSTMDVNDMRWGDRNTGRSLGRIVLERFEKGSSLTINPGGAGAVCVGANAADASSCGTAGGRWEDRGNEGLTVALKAAFEPEGLTSAGTTARNRLTWENNRRTDASGNSINGSGTQIIFDGYSTNDGLGTSDTNDYGFRANLNIDVFETKVLKKGNPTLDPEVGRELIYDDDTRTTFTYVENPTEAQKALRPLGFAVQGNVSFKDFQIDQVQLKHPDVVAPQTVFTGIVMQNLNMTTNLTATPIR
ncbi:DUF6160 family protein [Bacterioplanoides sp. SCSIO 12839]|uniref:DUF6160 family protein n=1 Tax=Bacterioplanoides sp. SCSIO 12839 TaxID=2829569 RepID=UPI0021027CFC|nr:DUF6160 family protein [Bacterioplanoides sp. SCSIO 12839]UTW48713.1 hypothetical protein KFF03_02065 [Bacterioplanoides sp. SCSIO 12839]